jgi:membrane fusion protein (multidrug efflux system)
VPAACLLSMPSKILYPVIAAVGIAAASGAAWWFQNRSTVATAAAPASPSARPNGADPSRSVTVEAVRVRVMKLTDDAQSVGSLRSRQSVMLRPEVSGRVVRLNFKDGERVRKGQLLVQFDDQLQQAQVKQSQAELSIARANHKRNEELLAQNFVSQRSLDESAANLEVAQAKLALAQATADRLRIIAPFDGIAGIRNVNVGDYLKDGADIVNLEDIDTVYVDYRLPERYQTQVRAGQRVSVELDALPGRSFEARVQAVDPLIDANGRSIGVRASIPNRQLLLRPGMFARVSTLFGVRERARVLPEEAIVPQGGRQFVIKLVPGPDNDTLVSRRVEVKVGIRRPGQVEIVEGLQEGDTVVTAGQQRLQRDGSPVKVLELNRPAAG